MEYKEKKMCRKCKIPLKIEDRWLLSVPNIYSLGFQYADVDMNFSRIELRKIFDLIDPKVDLSKFFTPTKDSEVKSYQFVLRGMIAYYGRHYWAYFYSQKFDGWFQFNDEHVRPTGNFQDVIEHCLMCRAIPRTVFFERQDILTSFITSGGLTKSKDAKKVYFAEENYKSNNFWKSRRPKPPPTFSEKAEEAWNSSNAALQEIFGGAKDLIRISPKRSANQKIKVSPRHDPTSTQDTRMKSKSPKSKA
jgi:hypothetical protein